MTLPQLTQKAKRASSSKLNQFVMANVVNETSLPYGHHACDRPEAIADLYDFIVKGLAEFEPDKEMLMVVCVSARYYPFGWHRVSIGTVDSTPAHPRDVLRPVIATNAYGFVLIHNHPSGDPSPSLGDANITRRIDQACDLMQIRFVDHVIMGQAAPGRTRYFSFREAGMLHDLR